MRRGRVRGRPHRGKPRAEVIGGGGGKSRGSAPGGIRLELHRDQSARSTHDAAVFPGRRRAIAIESVMRVGFRMPPKRTSRFRIAVIPGSARSVTVETPMSRKALMNPSPRMKQRERDPARLGPTPKACSHGLYEFAARKSSTRSAAVGSCDGMVSARESEGSDLNRELDYARARRTPHSTAEQSRKHGPPRLAAIIERTR